MTTEDELLEAERAGWEALSACGDTAMKHYDRVLARRVLMVLPGGLIIEDRAAALDAMSGGPWSSYELADPRVVQLTGDSAVLAYRARALRNEAEYTALVTSTFVREDGEWKLVVHQQTPA